MDIIYRGLLNVLLTSVLLSAVVHGADVPHQHMGDGMTTMVPMQHNMSDHHSGTQTVEDMPMTGMNMTSGNHDNMNSSNHESMGDHYMNTTNMDNMDGMDHSNHGDTGDTSDDMDGMDHSAHGDTSDTEATDHSSHDTGSAGHSLTFFFSAESVILFNTWVSSSWRTMLGSCFGIAAIAALYEGLKFFREYLQSNESKREKYSLDDKPSSTCACSACCTCMHMLQTVLHMVQVGVSYGLMLVVMTFNAWLVISVIVGAGIGYFIFGWCWRHSTETLEHCH